MLQIRRVGIFLCFLFFHVIGFSDSNSEIEPWISTDDLYNIKIDMTIEDVKNQLGDPLFIEAINEDVIITKFIYAFRTKEYDKKILEGGGVNVDNLSSKWGRTTNIQFVFEDDKLISWEEDKLTLSMTNNMPDKEGSAFGVFNMLLNIVVITLNAAVLMSQ